MHVIKLHFFNRTARVYHTIHSLSTNDTEARYFAMQAAWNICLYCRSPDGTCILTNSDDNVLRVFDLPADLHCQESWNKGRKLPELEPALRVVEGGLVYDYCWYPLMSSWNPLSCW
jgi:WD40 repeat protein